MKIKIFIALSSGFGGFLAVLADTGQKKLASAVCTFSENLRIAMGIPITPVIISIIIIIAAIVIAFIFEPENKRKGFFLGASILSIIFVMIPYVGEKDNQLKQNPSSEKVSIQINIENVDDFDEFNESILISVRNRGTQEIVGRSFFEEEYFFFYLDEGEYVLMFETPGYGVEYREILIEEDKGIKYEMVIDMEKTLLPNFFIKSLH